MMDISTGMPVMTGLIFADTNLVLYTIGKDARKKAIAREIPAGRPVVSVQVINEAVNVCLHRFAFTRERAYAFAKAVSWVNCKADSPIGKGDLALAVTVRPSQSKGRAARWRF
jgi:hypothetical protein